MILDGISFSVGAGESVALTGPNGSGKTSILRCILGLVPFEGEVTVEGRDVARDGIAVRERIGYLPQRPAFGDATAEEALGFVARLRGVPLARVDALLDEVGLLSYKNVRARTFSGGMQQRLSLAVALLGAPPVMLLDEPTASLDREGQRSFDEIAMYLRRRGCTLLIASHRSDEIARLTDRVIALEAGAIIRSPAKILPMKVVS